MTSKETRRTFLDFFKEKGHTIVPSAPMVVKNDPTLMFANAGMNVVFQAGSGAPYTRKSNITPEADFTTTENLRSVITGSLNGSRYPWNFKIDTKFDKDITFNSGVRKDGKQRKPVSMNIYLQILNVLNTQNVTTVYKATGNSSDDGYITSPGGIS